MHNTMIHTHQHSAHTPSPDPYFATCIGNATSTFIWEDDIPPLLMTPVLALHYPL